MRALTNGLLPPRAGAEAEIAIIESRRGRALAVLLPLPKLTLPPGVTLGSDLVAPALAGILFVGEVHDGLLEPKLCPFDPPL